MTPTEEALSAAADTFEQRLADPATRADFEQLCAAGQKPHVWRIINSVPGAAVIITCGREEHILPS